MNRNILLIVLLAAVAMLPFEVQAQQKVFRLGMIGLDTSHVTAFTKLINNSQAKHGCKVVVGYSGGSPDVESSASRVEGYTKQLRENYGVEIVDTIEELCRKVDGVLLESVDGRPHLKQARPVIKAGKPLFVDKPMAGNLVDVIEIFRLAKENNVPCWSSSSLRYSPAIVEMKKNNTAGDVLGCDTFGPCSLEEHQSVRRVQTDDYEHVVGIWEGGRVGTFRGLKAGKKSYGFTVYGSKGVIQGGKFGGYEPLVEDIIKFFKTGKVPVPPEETIEIFAFMSAADVSKARGGAEVSVLELIKKAKQGR
ncbi:MAG: Gfo/Idh/MocA family protein [Planctomycetota bacterium]|jgi:predicted dehydrogenase